MIRSKPSPSGNGWSELRSLPIIFLEKKDQRALDVETPDERFCGEY